MYPSQAAAAFLPPRFNFRHIIVTMLAAMFCVASLAAPAAANPRYAAYVMDAKTGKVLFARNADARRYPASLTKMMTIYMLFEAIESGRVKTSSQIPISAKAAAEPPTKMGLRAGSSISVDHAIKALVTRSANDIATAVGEFIGGSEQSFARMMTAKAKQLGMNSTQFRNAHGLPNSEQYTTARDMAILGIALREHFPKHYSYFSTRSFKFGKNTINTHNRLLGRVKGVDGIKTGYIRASGFNLVTSVQDGGRSIVGVVMGGQSGRSRDDHMAALIREHLPKASRGGSGNLIASRKPTPGTQTVAALALPSRDIPTPSFRPAEDVDMQVTAYVQMQQPPAVAAAAAVLPQRVTPPASVPVPVAAPAAEERFAVDAMSTASIQSAAWAVQISSSPSQKEALSALVRTGKDLPSIVADANAFIEEFNNKGTMFYRARFGFSSKNDAVNACNAMKKKKIDCFAAAL